MTERLKVYTTAPLEDPRDARASFRHLEEIGYDGAFSFEAKHDPFLPLVLAAENTTSLQLGTAIAIAFARSPMNLANLGHALQTISEGRFILGLGSAPHDHAHRTKQQYQHGAGARSTSREAASELVGVGAMHAGKVCLRLAADACSGRRPCRAYYRCHDRADLFATQCCVRGSERRF